MHKILYVCPSSGVGGAETFLKQTHSYCNKSLYENHYLLFQSGPLYDWLEQQGAKVHLLARVPRLSKMADRKLVADKIKQLINAHNINLVHSTMAYGAIFSAWPCKQINTPHVWFQHGPASGWMDRLAALLPHQGLIVNSHYTGKTQRHLENPLRFLVARKTPIEKILLGTDSTTPEPAERSAMREKLQQQFNDIEQPVLIAMLCRIQSWKGLHLFLEALKVLKQQQQELPIGCVVWGEAFKTTDYLEKCQQTVKDFDLPVYFAGHTDNPSLCLAACDLLVNASIQPEPFGLSIIEAMMVGAVPIVPDQGGPVEIVSKGKTGLIFKMGDAEDLARQLKTLAQDTELRQKLSQQAQQLAQQKFMAERAIGHLEDYYQKFLTV